MQRLLILERTARLVLMVAIVAIACLVAAVAVKMAFMHAVPLTPARWAKEWADDMMKEDAMDLARKYYKLADGFERTGARWDEATYHGPFSDRLPTGQVVVVLLPTTMKPCDPDRRPLNGDEAIPVNQGTELVVVKDWAFDDDSCWRFREIRVRAALEAQDPTSYCIERIYLQRRARHGESGRTSF